MRQLFSLLVLVGSLLPALSWAATPAGTIIRNQAVASYTNTDGNRVTVTSNLVETTIEAVAGTELTADQQLRVTAGTAVGFSHRLRNTGNQPDQYSLLAINGGGSINLDSLFVFADENADGIADNNTPLNQTPLIAAGDDYFVVVQGTVPVSVIDGDSALLTITATSEFDPAVSAQNTDEVTVGTGPAISVLKNIDQSGGLSPGGPFTVSLSYENSGDEDAGDVTLIDALPTGMSYVEGSARWSESSFVLSDADPNDIQQANGSSIRFCAYHSSCTALPEASLDNDTSSVNQISAIIDLVPAGTAGTVTFQVTIDDDLIAGFLQNTAEFEYDIAITTVARQYSNTVAFEVLASAGVVANGSTTSAVNGLNEPVSVTSAAQGGIVRFDNIIWNTGNATDTFNITVDGAASSFPTGTVWQLLRSGGGGALTDTNNDGIVDTGPIPPGEFSRVVLQLNLPAGAAGNNNGVGFNLTKTARSISDASVVDSVTDHLDEIVGNLVDLTNLAPAGAAGALGTGPGPEASPVTTVLAQSRNLAVFDLYIRHQGNVPDSYELSAASNVLGNELSDDWQVVFINADNNTAITSTGVLASGESLHVRAQVQLPVTAPAGTRSIWFSVQSANTGASDRKHDAFTLASTPSLSLEPSLNAQLEPGGTVVYEHLLINNGNTTINDVVLTLLDSRSDWSSVVYLDTNQDGALGPGDVPYSAPLNLLPGESRDIFVKVFAPTTASTLQRNDTSLLAQWNANTETVQVQDRSTVNQSHVVIIKEQAVDIGCDGQPDLGSVFGPGQIELAPGNNCVIYRLTAVNRGLEPSYNVKIHDYTPPYTVYRSVALCSRTPCWLAEPDEGDVGTINAETDQLLPGDSFFLQFVVQVE